MTQAQAAWGFAFAVQARADLDAYEVLAALPVGKRLPVSQELHFLQMVCEKLSKSHLCRTGDPATLGGSHGYVKSTLPVIALQYLSQAGYRRARKDHLLSRLRQLAGEIDLLHPQLQDSGRRVENVEYPWQLIVPPTADAGDVQVLAPAAYTFPNLKLREDTSGILLLKIVDFSIDNLLNDLATHTRR